MEKKSITRLLAITCYVRTAIPSVCIIGLSSVTSFASLTIKSSDKELLQKQLFKHIRLGKLNNVKKLLKARASLHDVNQRGLTPLHCASLFNQVDIARFLIAAGAVVNAHNTRNGATPLHKAVHEGHEGLVALLLNQKADVTLQNHKSHTPLYEAQKQSKTVIIDLLLKAGAQVPLTGGDKPHIMEKGESVKNGEHSKSNTAVVELLLQSGAQQQCISGGEKPYVIEKVERVKKGTLSITQQCTYDQQILKAAEDGTTWEVKRLLHAGANKDTIDKDGWTPLHWAAREGHKAVVELLLTAGANREATNKNPLVAETGATPLHIAACCGYGKIVDCLIEAGANKKAVTTDGKTLLHYAASGGVISLVELLLKSGVNKDAVDAYGLTPLHRAAQYGHQAVVDLLIKAGAKKGAVDDSGNTPLKIAQKEGHKAIVAMLLK